MTKEHKKKSTPEKSNIRSLGSPTSDVAEPANFWQTLPRLFLCLAPLANVTDCAFRKLIAEVGKPDVFYTEFVSADGLCSAGRERLLIDLKFSEAERPIVAQLFTGNPEKMEEAAAFVASLGFDGIDINMGCPDRAVEKQGAGSALIKDFSHAQKVIKAAKQGAGSLPVSVKTRLGYNKDVLEEWLPAILETEPAAVAIHARTRKEMSKVPAHWGRIADAVKIRDERKSTIPIIGNGDVIDRDDALKKVTDTGCDGIMLGRASFGNPWLFQEGKEISEKERLDMMVRHARLFEELLTDHKRFHYVRKHYRCYTNGLRGAKELRDQLTQAEDANEVEEIVQSYRKRVVT